MGSRMMVKGAARKGGMPLYKYVGNKLLTGSRIGSGTTLTRVSLRLPRLQRRALKSIPFEHNSDGFNFDTQIIIQLVRCREAHRRGSDSDLLRG